MLGTKPPAEMFCLKEQTLFQKVLSSREANRKSQLFPFEKKMAETHGCAAIHPNILDIWANEGDNKRCIDRNNQVIS